MSIDHVNLSKVDLGLLVVFDALVRDRHVTRAAQRIGLGQSATSHALGRLRRLFGDELLVRAGSEMVPTPRALALSTELQPILERLQSTMFDTAAFDPQTVDRRFRIGVSPSLEIALAPALLATLQIDAPGISVAFRTAPPQALLEAIDDGSLDLALGGFEDGAQHHRRRVLCESDGYMCLHAAAMTGLGAEITIDDFLRVPQITVLSNDEAARALDRTLRARGLSRRVAMETQNALAVPFILKRAPLMAVMCRRTARICAEQFGLSICELPFELPMQKVAMVWHSSSERDPACVWLRTLVGSAIPWREMGET